VSSTVASTSSTASFPALTILDWDDTILPTTWLRQIGVLSNNIAEMQAEKNPKPLSAAVQARLREIEALTIKCVEQAQKHSTVVIITNSSDVWIPYTCRKYLPGLEELFKTLYVSSARPCAPTDLNYHAALAVNWKVDKFRTLVTESTYDHVVSVGDGFSERCAVLALHGCGATAATAVRLTVSASIDRIIFQLRVLADQLPEMILSSSDECTEMVLAHGGRVFEVVPVGSVEGGSRRGAIGHQAENARPQPWNSNGLVISLMALCSSKQV